ncbi:Nn.00g027950.m01.CDS01 [Neocucurbitaria sp. VM-36]
MFRTTFCALAVVLGAVTAAPLISRSGPEPGQSSYYSAYRGKEDAYPANVTKTAILPSTHSMPGPDDLLFQNLLSAEWAIYSFYQQGVERFNTSAFVDAGFPNTTYDRISEIRDNEAGHLAIFQDQISSSSVKPGACEYIFPYTNAMTYLELGTLLEVSSMAFLTGLVLQAELNTSKSALVAIAETESRHNTWSLIDIWNANPFAGPSDTIFPYANEILESTNLFIKPGSCPKENPEYPSPSQKLPILSYVMNEIAGPGSNITFVFPDKDNQPKLEEGKEYYLVTFHGPVNVSAPYDVHTSSSIVPADIEAHKGILILVLADKMGVPTLESVVAGPLIIPQF